MIRTINKYAGRTKQSERVYRQRKVNWYLGLVGLVVWTCMAGTGIVMSLLNPDGSVSRPVLAAVFCGCFFGAFALLSLYLIVAYYRTSLSTSDATIRHHGVLGSKTLPVTDITRAVWRSWPRGGSLVLHTTDERLAVEFGPYEDSRDLAAFMRATLPEEVQEGYERFASTYIPASGAFARSRNREQQFFLALLPIAAVALTVLAFWNPHDIRSWFAVPLAFAIVLGVRALYQRWRATGSAADGA
jgi:hypothetical protein